MKLEEIPLVLQYNKRDLENKYSVEELNAALNPDGTIPWFEAVASQSKGVFETFRGVSHLLMEKVTKDLRRTPLSTSTGRAPRVTDAAPAGPPHNPLSLPNISAIPLPSNRASIDAPPNASGPMPSLEFGREVSLPQDAALGIVAEDPAPALRRPEPALSSRAERTDTGQRQHATNAPQSAVATVAPAPPAVEAGLSVTVQASAETESSSSRTRPGLRVSETGAESQSAAAVEAVVPVTIARGSTREIVLRIIITDQE